MVAPQGGLQYWGPCLLTMWASFGLCSPPSLPMCFLVGNGSQTKKKNIPTIIGRNTHIVCNCTLELRPLLTNYEAG